MQSGRQWRQRLAAQTRRDKTPGMPEPPPRFRRTSSNPLHASDQRNLCPRNVTVRLHPWDSGIGTEEGSAMPVAGRRRQRKREGSEKESPPTQAGEVSGGRAFHGRNAIQSLG